MTRRRSLTDKQKAQLLARYDYRCGRCGERLLFAIDFDHIKPLGLGGTNDFPDNWQPIHRKGCHREKSSGEVTVMRKADRQRKKTGMDPDAIAWRKKRAAKAKKIPKRVANNTLRRKLRGRVVPRDGAAKMA